MWFLTEEWKLAYARFKEIQNWSISIQEPTLLNPLLYLKAWAKYEPAGRVKCIKITSGDDWKVMHAFHHCCTSQPGTSHLEAWILFKSIIKKCSCFAFASCFLKLFFKRFLAFMVSDTPIKKCSKAEILLLSRVSESLVLTATTITTN